MSIQETQRLVQLEERVRQLEQAVNLLLKKEEAPKRVRNG